MANPFVYFVSVLEGFVNGFGACMEIWRHFGTVFDHLQKQKMASYDPFFEKWSKMVVFLNFSNCWKWSQRLSNRPNGPKIIFVTHLVPFLTILAVFDHLQKQKLTIYDPFFGKIVKNGRFLNFKMVKNGPIGSQRVLRG